MRLGVVSDLHANRPALEAVTADMPDVDRLLCAGDAVGYNPWPGACVDWLRERGVPTIAGNHDRMVTSERNFHGNDMARAGVEFARETLDDEQLRWLRELPPERALLDGRVAVVHGHPDDPDRYTYTRDFAPDLLGDAELLVLGHTHVQAHRRFDEGVVVNPGSVGQPRDGDPRAAYAVVELPDRDGDEPVSGDEIAVDERRVRYDVDAVAAAVEEAGLPPRTGSRLREGR